MGVKCSSCNAFKRAESVLSPIKSRNLSSYSKYKSETLMSPNKTSKKPTLVMPKLYTSKTCPLSQKISKLLNEAKLVFIPECLIKANNESPEIKYIFIRKIGEGSFGQVYYAKDKINKKEVSIKKIKKDETKQISCDNLSLDNEIDILKRLCHPAIIKIYEFYITKDSYYLINEYCKYGDLVSHIKKGFDEMQISFILYQILSGIFYLHFNNIIHRDLKLENILVSKISMINIKGKINEFLHIKIIDFGTAKLKQKSNEKTVIGTLIYMAPEVIKQNYNNKCDLWSIGVILYILITGDIPFEGKTEEEITTAILKGKYNKNNERLKKFPKSLQSLLRHLLDINPETRYSAIQALNCEFFKKYDPNILYKKIIQNQNLDKYFDNLINYQLTTKMEQMFLAIICHHRIFDEEQNNILILFGYLNKKKDGLLTKKELYEGLTDYYKMKGEETGDYSKYNLLVYGDTIEEIFILLDTDNSDYIEYEEFIRGCLEKNILMKDDYVKELFKKIDKENKGEICLEQIRELIKGITNDSNKIIDEIIEDIHTTFGIKDEDIINYEQFKELFQYSRNKYNR